MLSAFCLVLAALFNPIQTEAGGPVALVPGPRTVFVYSNQSGTKKTQFVLRLGRFQPDILFEWESTADQGTVQLYRKAVRSARRFTLSGLFDVGVDTESADEMTVWFSQAVCEDLLQRRKAEVVFNSIPLQLRVQKETPFSLELNGQPVHVKGLELTDARQGRWNIYPEVRNCLVLEYQTKYFHQRLKSVSTNPRNMLRWIKKSPPIR